MFGLASLRFKTPTATRWLAVIQLYKNQLLNVRPQMLTLLDAVRQDIDKQFDEKQGEWKPLRPYTIAKKEAMNADMRILHETKEGQGLRLRDAYAKSGYVDGDGRLIFTYPAEKPYAIEHQEGKVDANADRKSIKTKPKKKRRKTRVEKLAEGLEDEFFDRFG
jgi:hypothetical protein